MKNERLKNFLKTLGPGILFASTAIGVSHLVQSTRAGANFGFALVPFILAANIFKYPFFEFGSRYANATGESLIDGYKRIGNWMLWLYFLITIGSMFFVCAAVGSVTSGFLQGLFGGTDWGMGATFALFTICAGILLLGKYKVLDSLVKIIGFVLLLSVLLAFVLALFQGPNAHIADFKAPDLWAESSVLFIIALMGWMPTAVDLSAWNSLWTIERIKQTGYKPTMRETLADFNFGYIISAVLSICFVTLGAYMMFGTDSEIPDGAGPFAVSVIGMFTAFIGEWSYIIIAAAAFSIMFGTCIAVFDGYSRSIERSTALFLSREKEKSSVGIYNISLAVVAIGSFSLVFFFGKHMKSLIDLAMTISFLIAPVIAVVNLRLVTGKYIDEEHKPKMWLKILSWMGILLLTGFALYFAWVKFF
jgi:Mn2+/Fe2+ NRAMP family transporter